MSLISWKPVSNIKSIEKETTNSTEEDTTK